MSASREEFDEWQADSERADDRREFSPRRKIVSCSDGMCGATDCTKCGDGEDGDGEDEDQPDEGN